MEESERKRKRGMVKENGGGEREEGRTLFQTLMASIKRETEGGQRGRGRRGVKGQSVEALVCVLYTFLGLCVRDECRGSVVERWLRS